MKTIEFLDLRSINQEIEKELLTSFSEVLRSGTYVMGEQLCQFEKEYATYCGVKHCIGVANGLDALKITLTSWGIGAGDEVIVPSNTFIATWLAVSQVGAEIIPVEPNINTFNITADAIKSKLSSKTKVIIPVHLFGQPADMNEIINLAKNHGIKVLEDAAQAHGATYENSMTGSLGDAAGFSFYPGKNLGALGDGGCITTNNDDLAKNAIKIRNYGSEVKYKHDYLGVNSRLDEIQAAFLRIKLKKLNSDNLIRRNIADIYLKNIDTERITLPSVLKNTTPAWHNFVVRVKNRDRVQQQLLAAGIKTLIHYPIPPHMQECYRNFDSAHFDNLIVAEQLSCESLSLPIGPHLTTTDALRVSKIINEITKQ